MGLESIRSFFGTTMPTLSVLPPCYTYNPYAMRDDDQDEPVQEPRTYHPDCDGSSFGLGGARIRRLGGRVLRGEPPLLAA